MNSVFLPKDDQELPDNYSIIVEFHSGKVKEIEVASHKLIELVKVPDPSGPFVDKENRHYRLEPSSAPFIEYVTKDDLIGNLPVASYQSIVFDKRYSKIIEINRKLSEKKDSKEN